MKIKHKINISGYEIETIIVSQEDINQIYVEHGGEPGKEICGLFQPKFYRILLSDNQSKAAIYSTWIHEIIEAINFIYALDMEHRQIEALESGLFGLGIKVKGE